MGVGLFGDVMSKVEMTATVNYQFLMDCHVDPVIDTIVLEGSTRSTKTFSIMQYLVLEWAIKKEGSVVRVFRYDSTTHNATTIATFKDVMNQLCLWQYGSWNGQEKIFRFDNGSIIAFSATSDKQKLHGLEQDVAYYNEAMEIHEDSHAQIAYRTKILTIMDFNPSFNQHWIFSQLVDADRPNVAYKHSTYKDNPFLYPKQIDEIEKYEPTPENKKRGTADAYKWAVYGLGQRGKVEGAIFKLFEVTDFFPEPEMCQRHGYGLDFGFTMDPTGLIECALYQDKLYLREVCYETGLITTPNISRPNEPSIQAVLEDNEISKDSKIYADCANPQQIADLNFSGYNVVACTKGKDSIINGIDLIRQTKMMIYRASHNLRVELERYRWKQDRSGNWKREPVDEYNHLIDGIRYWANGELYIAKLEKGGGFKPKQAITSSRAPRTAGRQFR